MSRCQFSPSSCNGPKESECMGLCTHRINTDYMQKRVVSIKGRVEELPVQMHEPGLITKLRQFYRGISRNNETN